MSNGHTYLRLTDATAEMFFGKGAGITRNSLLRAARRQYLKTTTIAGKSFTTAAWLNEMAERMARPAVADHALPTPEDADAAVARAEAAIESLRARS
jgi:hypothetical protein